MLSLLTRKALADVTRRKGRTILAILGIMIGVLGLTAVNIANDAIGGAFLYSHDERALPDMTFTVQTVPSSLPATLAHLPNVDKVQILTQYTSLWHISRGSGSASLQINGYQDVQQIQLGTIQLSRGRWPGRGEIVMDSSDTTLQSFALGETIIVDAPRPPGGTVALRVVGLFRTSGRALTQGSAQAYAAMSADALQQIAHLAPPQITDKKHPEPTFTTVILIKAHDTSRAQHTFDTIQQTLNKAHIPIYALTLSSANSGTKSIVNGLISVIRVLASIALLLTSFLIINTVTTLVTEQMKIIGTMKAIGGNRSQIIRSYLISVGIYSLVGTGLGMGGGIAGGYQLASLFAASATIDLGPFQVSPWVLITSAVLGVTVPLLSALLPLWTGTRITVGEAMAAYGVSAGNISRAGPWGHRLAWMPQTTWLGVRSTFRKPARALLTLLALTLSSAVFMSVQTANSSLSTTFDQVLHTFHSDVMVTTQGGLFTAQQRERLLQSLPNVERIEPLEIESVTTSRGALALTALEAETHVYQPQLLAGRWLANQEQGSLVISDIAARALNVHIGDHVFFHEDKYQATWLVVGMVHDLNNAQVGSGTVGSAFTTIESLNRSFFQAPGNKVDRAPILMIQARNHASPAVDEVARQLATWLENDGIQADIVTQQQSALQFQQIVLFIFLLFSTAALIVALVGILSLSTTLSSSVLERSLEIGLLRSMGATGWQVASVFWTEGIVLALIAWALGVLLGLPGAYALVYLLSATITPLDFFFHPAFILITLLFVVVVTGLSSIGPALSASRMRIRETLRYE